MKARFMYFVICLILVNCNEAKPELTLKYSDRPIVINCNEANSKLLTEALYHFEESIISHYNNQNTNLSSAYRSFLRESVNNRTNYNNIADQHSLDIFQHLNQIHGLWLQENNKPTLNYNHELFKCIGENIIDIDTKTTYNALLSTNSMSLRMLKDVLITKSSRLISDKYLAMHVALELYYSKLSSVDLSKKQATPDNTQLMKEKDPHAGHNHD